MKLEVAPAEPLHIPPIVADIREADRQELAAVGYEPTAALIESYSVSDPDMCWTALLDGVPVAMWGVARQDDLAGVAWLLSANGLLKAKRDAWELSKRYVAEMHSRYPILFNLVDARNRVSRRWLSALGFTAGPASQSFSGHPFMPYVSLRRV